MTPRLLAAAVALVLLAGCTGNTPDPAPSSSPSPSPSADVPSPTASPATAAPRPSTGACYALTYTEALESTSSVRPGKCKRPHTARTFFVGTVDAVVDGHLLAVDSARVQDAIAAACPQRLGRYLGGDQEARRLSMLRAIWFSPSIEQSDAGQNWFRCDVIALAGDQALARLGGDLKGVLDTSEAADFAMCGTADPESARFERVICSAPHTWEAVATVDADQKTFPGPQKLRTDGKAACEDPARAVAPDPLTVTWSYEPPTLQQWRGGQHYGVCWVPSS
ncbi:septum formation family protein [Nocardioides sp.]|uniref:septum formation family protein n=1 Tax=Nocardioides sp. TaxID=35761 RepID=UPI003D09CBAE